MYRFEGRSNKFGFHYKESNGIRIPNLILIPYIEHLLCARHSTGCSTFYPHHISTLISIFQMGKLNLRLCNSAKIMQLMMWLEPGFALTLEIANLSMRWNCEMMWTFQEGVQSRAKGLFKMVRLKGKGGPPLESKEERFLQVVFTNNVKTHFI